jgi:subunit length determinant Wzz-like protein
VSPWLDRVRRRLPAVAALVVAAAGAAALYSFTATKRYEARAELLVSPLPAGDTTFAGFGLPRAGPEAGAAAATVARLVRTPEIAEAVQSQLGLPGSRTEVLDSVSSHRIDDSQLVSVVGKDSRPDRAAQIANAFADELVAVRTSRFQTALTAAIRRLRARLRAGVGDDGERRALARRLGVLTGLVATRDPTLEVASNAVAPKQPAWPRPWLLISLAALGAVLVGVLTTAFVPVPAGREPFEFPPVGPPPPAPPLPPVPEPEPESEPGPEPVPEPEPATPREGGAWNLAELRRLVEERGAQFPERLDSWNAYLYFLQEHAAAGGELPGAFDALVEDEFRELLPP